MTLYQAWPELCQAVRIVLWHYRPETIFFASLLIGLIGGMLLALVTYPGLL
jgi:hypothetical protein